MDDEPKLVSLIASWKRWYNSKPWYWFRTHPPKPKNIELSPETEYLESGLPKQLPPKKCPNT